MKLLVLGGSVFLGRHTVQAALARGWEITTFNRGRTGADVPGAQAVRGDRTDAEDLARLAALGPWDAVVDVCGFTPRDVAASARALSPRAGAYVFVSSISAIADWPAKAVDEDAPIHECEPDAGEDAGDYGVLKAGCERAAERYFTGGRTLVLSPGLIMGPYDNVGRVEYWLRRVAEGGRFLAPGHPDRALQLIDARDIAAFTLDAVEKGLSGRYLASGVLGVPTWGEFLQMCARVTGSRAEPVWVDDSFLVQQEVKLWTELPLWAPHGPDWAGLWQPSSQKALADGLVCRPVEDSLHDTWQWLSTEAPEVLPRYARHSGPRPGMDPERERAVLTAWESR
ncbi:NAD-dependent epimerase/dehydratase family protein [Streptomyces capparidis]